MTRACPLPLRVMHAVGAPVQRACSTGTLSWAQTPLELGIPWGIFTHIVPGTPDNPKTISFTSIK